MLARGHHSAERGKTYAGPPCLQKAAHEEERECEREQKKLKRTPLPPSAPRPTYLQQLTPPLKKERKKKRTEAVQRNPSMAYMMVICLDL